MASEWPWVESLIPEKSNNKKNNNNYNLIPNLCEPLLFKKNLQLSQIISSTNNSCIYIYSYTHNINT